tara:strand:- start:359 stop:1039 length:681 start_codon:yes stop_codon:yes gene_type:complete
LKQRALKTAMKKIVLIGAGGHARVLIDTLSADKTAEVCGILDNNRDLWGIDIHGIPVIGGDDFLPKVGSQGATHFVIAIGGAKQAALRLKLYEIALQHGLTPASVQHPSAIISPRIKVGEGVQALAQCVINTGVTLQENSIVNTSAIIEHDCFIEAHAHIAPRACLAGGVRVGEGTHIGLGSIVKENITIGKQVVVGAGAVVLNNVPAHSVVVGVPAKPIVHKEVA